MGTHHFRILKQDTTDFQAPVGTGPFKLQEFQPGIRSIHVRNDNYWRDGAHLDELELFAITESTARVSALLAGDVEMISNLDPQAIQAVEAADNVEVWSVPSGSFPCIVCRTDTDPGSNRDFVMALKYLQQRERIVKSVLKGQGTIGNDQLIVIAALGSSIPILIFITAVVYTPGVFRLARALGQDIMVQDFVEAARLRGEGLWWFITREVLPNAVMPLVTDFGFRMVFVILFISSLSFLGLGVQPPMADWGSMVRENMQGLSYGAFAAIWPALAIASLTISINLIVDDISAASVSGLAGKLA